MSKKIDVACIIDDDNIYINLVKRIIESKHLCKNLLIFENGKNALNFFEAILNNPKKENIPEIIFLDLNMPVMDGWEFLANFIQIKNDFGKAITLYIVSSSINPLDIKKAKSIRDVKDYLVKPVTIQELESIFSMS